MKLSKADIARLQAGGAKVRPRVEAAPLPAPLPAAPLPPVPAVIVSAPGITEATESLERAVNALAARQNRKLTVNRDHRGLIESIDIA